MPGMGMTARATAIGAMAFGVTAFGALLLAQPASAQGMGARSGAAADLSSCGGRKLRAFVGKPLFRLTRRRPDARTVCEPGCMMTMDYQADRLTVIYDTRTKRIKRMQCG